MSMLGRLAATFLLVLPLAVSAGSHRRHHQNARGDTLSRRGPTYKLVDDYNKDTFLDMFTFFTSADPTHGLVDFVSKDEAMDSGLAFVQDDGTVVLAVDDTTQLKPGQNRKSIHINSKNSYNAGTLFLADIYSMPHGCATWPAYWTVGPNWPNGGELDVIEGVNEQSQNQVTAHTGNVCTLSKNVDFTGHLVATTCQSSNGGNAGCAYVTPNNNTYGHGFNLNAGGVYAHTWEEDAIQVWFFPRGAIPDDITNGDPEPDTWGTPAAIFSNNDKCNIGSSFHDHQIVFDITLCGDWAGAAYSAMGCPGTCAQQVADPDNFKLAKFKIAGLKVYEHN